jgi:nucleotide-binding universal stress UspA family protein
MYRVLVPIDRNERRAAAQARTVLDLPADPETMAVTLLHVVGEREPADDADVERMAAAKKASALLGDAGVAVDHAARSGDPPTEILAAVDAGDADLIAIARGREDLGEVLFGSTAEAVLDAATRPVLVAAD